MSVYNKPDIKNKIASNTPVFSHKKNNSVNILNTGKFLQGKNTSNCLYKNKLEIRTNSNIPTDINNSNNVNNRLMSANSNINKLLTSTNLKNRRIEIDLDKDNSNINNSARDNIMILNHKQNTSQNNITNKNKNSFNNINININISKKIISTYYNKSKDKKNIVINKKSINSMNNSKINELENKYCKINNKENMNKNPSEAILRKYSTKNMNDRNINYSNKNKVNPNSSSSTNMTKKNVQNNSNINRTTHMNYTSNDIYNNNINYNNYNRKKNGSVYNKKVKDNKSTYLSQIQIPMNVSFSPRNINSMQNYLKYLNISKNNKILKNNPQNKSQKIDGNMTNNNNLYNETDNNLGLYNRSEIDNTHNSKNIIDANKEEKNNILNRYSTYHNNSIGKNSTNCYDKDIIDFSFESPEELHYFYVKIFQRGKSLNFDKNIK